MIFEEADAYKNKNDLKGFYEDVPFNFKYIFIAPKDFTTQERIELLKEALYTELDNKGVLIKRGLLHSNLDVYIYGTDKDEVNYYEDTLYNYLSKQKLEISSK